MMHGNKRITPEEKLLNIIESPKEVRNVGARRKFGLQGFLSKGKLWSHGKINFKKIGLRDINKLLFSAAIIATLIFLVYFVKEERHLRARFENLVKGNIEGGSDAEVQQNIPNMSTYLDATEKSNPFNILPFTEKIKPPKQLQKSEFKLVGIIWSSNPQAIIEDSASSKTYVVYEGDAVGEFVVDKISKNEATISDKNGKKTLR